MDKEYEGRRVLVFDVWGDYAHFRRSYTTTSPLTHSIPPRTALTGLISAIIGKDKDEYLAHFTKDKADISLKIHKTNPVKKGRIAQNLINTKDNYFTLVKKKGHEPRTQILFEFIKDPRYRIYFYHQEEDIYQKLKQHLKEHKSVYTPCLGLSEHLANFKFVNEFTARKRYNEDKEVLIDSVLPKKHIIGSRVDFESNNEYFSVLLPAEMNPRRVITEYEDILFERNGEKIKAVVNHYWELENGERIVFL